MHRYNIITLLKNISSKVVLWEIILDENGGDRTKLCATSNISGTEVFLDKCFVSKDN